MAIQMRRGQLANYDKSKMLPGEWGISIDNDSDNQKAFISFAPGVSKEVMMVEDAEEQIAVATAEAIDMATEEAEAWAHGNSFHVNDYASGDGSTKSFTLAETPSSILGVYVDGSSVSSYTLSGKTITFTTAPASGSNNIRVYYTVNTTTDNAKYYKEQAEAVAESIPEDYSDLSDDVDQLKNAINALSITAYMVECKKGETASSAGELKPFHAKNGDIIVASTVDGSNFVNVQLWLYDKNRTFIINYQLSSGYGKTRTITYNQDTDAYYAAIITVDTSSPDYYLIVNESNPYKEVITELSDDIIDLDKNKMDKSEMNIINRFNPETRTNGKYLSIANGQLADLETYFTSDYIYVGDLDNITCSYTHLICFYAGNYSFVSGLEFRTTLADGTIARPENAVYVRFSNALTNVDYSQIGENISRANYVPYGYFTMPSLKVRDYQIINDDGIVVDASGNGDYTSFTLACKENYSNNIQITVKAGTYDIVSEYVAIWGQSAVDNMADSDDAVFDGWQFGVRINNRKILFEAGAKIVCDWTGHTVDGTHRFSALRVEMDTEIIGLNLNCIHTFYAIHDDYGVQTKPYTNKYENCFVIGSNLTNVNCIGGGCKKWSRHILKNCYFDNGTTDSTVVRYHNTNFADAVPEVYISNCYFSSIFKACYYGSQESKMLVYVNNCEAKSIMKEAESSSYNVDNINLYKWCNAETA